MSVITGVSQWENVISDANPLWTLGTFKHIGHVSVHSLVFNFCFLFAYWLVCNKQLKNGSLSYRMLNRSSLASLTWVRCFIIVLLGTVVFMSYNGIVSFSKMEVGEWYEHRSNSRVLGLLSSLIVPVMSLGVIWALFTKDIIRGFLLILPILIIGLSTGARSQIIPFVFYVLFYYLWANKRIKIKNLLIVGAFAFIAIYILTITREEVYALYPLYKDWAYVDLFYVYDVGESITTHGLNTLSMLLRDFIPQRVQDITLLLADTKYGIGWGSLHPSIIGWAYVDLLGYYWVLAILFGIWIAFFDRLRHHMPILIYLTFLSYEFSFLAIAIRGSVQFAYSQLFYPTLLLVGLYLLDRFKVIKCHV